LVTGGTSGIGLAAAARIAAEGAHVFVTGRTQPSVDAAVRQIGANTTGIRRNGRCQPAQGVEPQSNDLVLQLRKRALSKVILCGMLANMCVESHLRDLLEEGFEVAVVSDATAGPRHPIHGDGYQSALINYAFLAHAVVSTAEVADAMSTSRPPGAPIT
jgi:nucleoside-diphosphate-sugar epimerase